MRPAKPSPIREGLQRPVSARRRSLALAVPQGEDSYVKEVGEEVEGGIEGEHGLQGNGLKCWKILKME